MGESFANRRVKMQTPYQLPQTVQAKNETYKSQHLGFPLIVIKMKAFWARLLIEFTNKVAVWL